MCANSPKLTRLHYQLLFGKRAHKVQATEGGRNKAHNTKRYEGFRQVHDIHKYFDELGVSVVCSVYPTCHHCIGF